MRGTGTGIVVVGLVVALLAGIPAGAAGAADQGKLGDPEEAEIIPGHHLVSVADPAVLDELTDEVEAAGGVITTEYDTVLTGFAATMPARVARSLAARPGVSVQPDLRLTISAAQASPPWGLDRIDQPRGLDRTYAYNRTGKGVSVYVIDSGVRADHADFGGRVVRGFDATGAGTTRDCSGHGTHVAGTIAGTRYGVAKQATIIPVRVFNCDGVGRLSWGVAGLEWVVKHHQAGRPAVANLSGGGPANDAIDRAARAVITDGVALVTAAGNDGWDACRYSPGRVGAAITVAATDRTDYSPNWSNYGPCVDLFAPGVGVASAWHTSTTATRTIDGTSMAAPHVAGAAAVYLQGRPAATPAQVSDWLRAGARTGLVSNPGSATANRLLHVPGKVPTKVALAAPARVASGSRASLTATLTNGVSGVAIGARDVVLYRRTRGTTAWTKHATVRTSAAGTATFSHAPTTVTEYQVRHGGAALTLASTSAVRTVTLDTRAPTALTATVSAPVADAEVTRTVTGRLTQSGRGVPGAVVELQRRQRDGAGVMGSWTKHATRTSATSGTIGSVSFPVRPDRTIQYRLVAGSTSTTLGSVSSAVTASARFVVTTSIWNDDEYVEVHGHLRPISVDWSSHWLVLEARQPGGTWVVQWELDYDRRTGEFFDAAWAGCGTTEVRVRAPGDAWNAAGVSPTTTIDVPCELDTDARAATSDAWLRQAGGRR